MTNHPVIVDVNFKMESFIFIVCLNIMFVLSVVCSIVVARKLNHKHRSLKKFLSDAKFDASHKYCQVVQHGCELVLKRDLREESRKFQQLDQEIKEYNQDLRDKLLLEKRLRFAAEKESLDTIALEEEFKEEEKSHKIYQNLLIHLRRTTIETEEKTERIKSRLHLQLKKSVEVSTIANQCTDTIADLKIKKLSILNELKTYKESENNRQTPNAVKKPWNSSVRVERNRR